MMPMPIRVTARSNRSDGTLARKSAMVGRPMRDVLELTV